MTIPMNAHKQQGFSLLEVLIAMFILAVGLLGAGALQMMGVQGSQDAFNRSQAIYMAYDIADRMRANPDAIIGTNAYDNINSANAAPADPGCAAAVGGCTAAQMATLDVREWVQLVSPAAGIAALPGATGTVVRTAGTDNFTVTVNWQSRDWDSDAIQAADAAAEAANQAAVDAIASGDAAAAQAAVDAAAAAQATAQVGVGRAAVAQTYSVVVSL